MVLTEYESPQPAAQVVEATPQPFGSLGQPVGTYEKSQQQNHAAVLGIARYEARHGKAFAGLLKRYFGK